MDATAKTFPRLESFNSPYVEHITVWTSPAISTHFETLPRHRHASVFGELQIDAAKPAKEFCTVANK